MKRITYLTTFLLALAACSNEAPSGMTDQLNEAIDETLGDAASEYTGHLDQLLTLQLASDIAGLPADNAAISYNQVLKNPQTHSLSYTWPSERTQHVTVGGHAMELPADNRVELSWVRNTTLKDFKNNYRNLTEDERKHAAAAMNKEMDKMVEEGKATKEQADMAGGFAEGLTSNYRVLEVPNLGDRAVWIERKKYPELKVFYKGLEFQLNVDLSDDNDVNKEKAIALARRIIAEKL